MPAVLLDFDGTAFETVRPPSGGIGVPEAYERAIEGVLGPIKLGRFRDEGGLRNRAPFEVVRALLPRSSVSRVENKTADVVQYKIKLLAAQIGREDGNGCWPPPCAGFLDFWRRLTRSEGKDRTLCAVVSSGHDAIIEAVFRLYRLQLPDVIISDDVMQQETHLTPEERMKPSPKPLELALTVLAESYGEERVGEHDGIVYFGDDLAKDGEMARRAGVIFGHYRPEASAAVTDLGFQFPHWGCARRFVPALASS